MAPSIIILSFKTNGTNNLPYDSNRQATLPRLMYHPIYASKWQPVQNSVHQGQFWSYPSFSYYPIQQGSWVLSDHPDFRSPYPSLQIFTQICNSNTPSYIGRYIHYDQPTNCPFNILLGRFGSNPQETTSPNQDHRFWNYPFLFNTLHFNQLNNFSGFNDFN